MTKMFHMQEVVFQDMTWYDDGKVLYCGWWMSMYHCLSLKISLNNQICFLLHHWYHQGKISTKRHLVKRNETSLGQKWGEEKQCCNAPVSPLIDSRWKMRKSLVNTAIEDLLWHTSSPLGSLAQRYCNIQQVGTDHWGISKAMIQVLVCHLRWNKLVLHDNQVQIFGV